MFSRANKWLIAATGIGIFYALALLIFAGDVFNKDQSISQTVFDVGLHLVPTVVVLLFVFVGYKKPLIGAAICLVSGLIYIITGWANLHWTAHVVIAGPLLVLSMLYIMAYKSIK
jgi:hypothetical protein